MKVSVNDKELFTLSEVRKKVIMDYLPKETFDEDMKRRLHWVLNHLYEESFKKLKCKWEPVLAKRIDAVPTDADKLVELIFSQPDYRDRSDRGD